MAKSLVFMAVLLLISAITFAQSNLFSITGTVVDSSTGNHVELASVALKASGDKTILSATTADVDGKFTLQNVKPGKYEMLIAFMGYNSKTLTIEVKGNVTLDKIYISSSINTLKAAVVTAERPEISIDAEKTVFNV